MRFDFFIKYFLLLLSIALISCTNGADNNDTNIKKYPDLGGIAKIAPGWKGEVVAIIDEPITSDITIGDADNDGENEILTTSKPLSSLYLFKKVNNLWETRWISRNLARCAPCMTMDVKVVDLNRDGINEVILGTGSVYKSYNMQRAAFFYILQTDGHKLTKLLLSQPDFNYSRYTNGLSTYDLDGDGVVEVISTYCGNGEVIRYDVDEKLTKIEAKKLGQAEGAGEDSLIADVDNDGRMEYIHVDGFREDKARVGIYEFDERGELILEPKVILDGFDGKKQFTAAVAVGDVDNDGNNELIVSWKAKGEGNEGTLLGYRVKDKVERIYTFEYETQELGRGMVSPSIADADNDGKNELVVTTGWEEPALKSGHVYLYKVVSPNDIKKELILGFNKDEVRGSTLVIGDADNDGKNEIVLGTGKGDPDGKSYDEKSYIIILEKE